MKSYSRFLILAIVATMAQSCFYNGEITTFGIMFFVILGIMVLIFVFGMINTSAELKEKAQRDEEQRRIREATKKIEKEQEQKRINKYNDDCAEIYSKMGEADKTIRIVNFDVNQEIRAYSKFNKVVILGKEYDFTSIIQCQLTDNASIEKGRTTITSQGTTKTNTGNMVGRAVVGGVLAGGAGAIIGGSTASKDTVTTSVVNQGSDITRHDYTVWITVKDIANPMIQIHIGRDGSKANEIVALMNAIISQ